MIGPLHEPVTWYRINYAGTQITQWGFQNKGTRTSPARLSFGLEVQLRYLRPSIIYSVPRDRFVQRSYYSLCFNLMNNWQNCALANHCNEMLSRVIETANHVGRFCKAIQHCLGRTRRANVSKSFHKFHFTWQLGVAGAALLVAEPSFVVSVTFSLSSGSLEI